MLFDLNHLLSYSSSFDCRNFILDSFTFIFFNILNLVFGSFCRFTGGRLGFAFLENPPRNVMMFETSEDLTSCIDLEGMSAIFE